MLNVSTFDARMLEDDGDSTEMYIANTSGENYRRNSHEPPSPRNDDNCWKSLEPVKGMIIAMLLALLFWLALAILLIR